MSIRFEKENEVEYKYENNFFKHFYRNRPLVDLKNERVVSKPSKFNAELDFCNPAELKEYLCPKCEQELIYNRKDNFKYCPVCTEGYNE